MHIPRHQKTYLSRAMTRSMSAEHPIGDPHGGPAYGERNEPVSAIISIGTMLFTGAEVIAGTATLMQGLTFAGAALSLVGNATGNSTLSKLGMITGLAGGVGMLAENIGNFTIGGTMGDTFGYGSGATTASGVPLSQTTNPAASAQGAELINNAGATPGMNQLPAGTAPVDAGFNLDAALADSAGNLANAPSQGLVSNAMGTPDASSLVNTSAPASSPLANTAAPTGLEATGAPAAPGTPAAPGAPATPGAPTTPSTGGRWMIDDQGGKYFMPEGGGVQPGSMTPAPDSAFGTGGAAGNKLTGAEAAWQSVKNGGSELMQLAKTNPGAAYMLGMGLSSAADVLSGKTGAQIDALQAQGELSRTQADNLRYQLDLAKRRQTNLNAHYTDTPNPLASWKPDFQVVPVGQQPGLISGAQQPAKA